MRASCRRIPTLLDGDLPPVPRTSETFGNARVDLARPDWRVEYDRSGVGESRRSWKEARI